MKQKRRDLIYTIKMETKIIVKATSKDLEALRKRPGRKKRGKKTNAEKKLERQFGRGTLKNI